MLLAYSSSSLISIHAPRAGSDVPRGCCVTIAIKFQSTLPVRGATGDEDLCPDCKNISIHAPRAGSDLLELHSLKPCPISIHAPRAGSDVNAFQYDTRAGKISIHAPRAGSDL